MIFEATDIDGVFKLKPDVQADERGFFARLSCPEDFHGAGITFVPRQTSLSRNYRCHTLRGLHYATESEAKLVRCVRGRIFDVALDIRKGSRMFGAWVGAELDAESSIGLFIPGGVAHGFLTLEEDCDVLYQIDRIYRPGFDTGVRWNDPLFSIRWPATPEVIHPRDANYSDFRL